MRNQWPGIVTAAVDNRFVQPAQDHRDAWCRLPLLLRRDSPSWAAQLAAPAVTGLSEQMQNTSAFRATRQLRHIARSLLHVTPCNRWQRQYRQGQHGQQMPTSTVVEQQMERVSLGSGLKSSAHGQAVSETGQAVTTQCQRQAQTF